jgi:hypothetical protein
MRSSSLLLSRGYLSSPSVVVRVHYREAVLGFTRVTDPFPLGSSHPCLTVLQSQCSFSLSIGCAPPLVAALSHPLSRLYLNVVLCIDPLPPVVLHPWRFGFPPIGTRSMVTSGHHPLYTCKLWPNCGGSTDSPCFPYFLHPWRFGSPPPFALIVWSLRGITPCTPVNSA